MGAHQQPVRLAGCVSPDEPLAAEFCLPDRYRHRDVRAFRCGGTDHRLADSELSVGQGGISRSGAGVETRMNQAA